METVIAMIFIFTIIYFLLITSQKYFYSFQNEILKPWIIKSFLILVFSVNYCHGNYSGILQLQLSKEILKNQNERCQTLSQKFIKELHEISPDQKIIIDTESTKETTNLLPETYQLTCNSTDQTVHLLNDENHYTFTYSEKAEGFDSTEWLAFQKRPNLNLRPPSLEALSPGNPNLFQTQNPVKSGKIYEKWWFWATITVAAGGLSYFMISKMNSEPQRVSIAFR